MSINTSRGIVHGKPVELIEDLGLEDGQEVNVIVEVRKTDQKWGQGILQSAGAMAPYWSAEDDEILAEIDRDRRQASTRALPQ
jgi:hypothetical protein